MPEASDRVRTITEPSVVLYAAIRIGPDGMDRFLSDHGITWDSDAEADADIVVETAGRLCYMSYDKPRPGGNAAYLKHIKEVGHGSVLEHTCYQFIIYGVSRSLTHELVRHRSGCAYSQLSQRYVDESVAEYVCPDIIRADPWLYSVWLDAVENAHAAYRKLSLELTARLATDHEFAAKWLVMNKASEYTATERRKVARQAARSVLPNATETKIAFTCNARALRHVLEQRGSVFAEPEIRKLAYQLYKLAVQESPNLFADYRCRPLSDGTIELTTDYRKV